MLSLDSLDVTSWLQILSFLDACTLGRMACASGLLAVASEEAQCRPALLVLKGKPDKVVQEMRQQLAARPSIAIVHYSGRHAVSQQRTEDVMDLMQRVLPKKTSILAAQTNSLLCIPNTLELCGVGEGVDPEEIGVLLATLPEATSKAFFFNRVPGEVLRKHFGAGAEERCRRAFYEEDDEDYDEESESSAEEEEQQQRQQQQEVSSDQVASKDGDWLGSLGSSTSGSGAATAGSNGEACLADGTSQEAKPQVKKLSDLEADYEELFSLDPPPEVIIVQIAGDGQEHVELLQSKYPKAAIIGGFAMGGQAAVRDVSRDGRQRLKRGDGVALMAIAGNVPVHAMTCPMLRTLEAAQGHVTASLDRAVSLAASDSKRILGALLFTCNARQQFEAYKKDDATQFLQRVPKAQLLGCYAGGEVGPEARGDCTFVRGHAKLQGFTAVFGVFLVPDKQAPSLHFQRAVLDGDIRGVLQSMGLLRCASV